MTKRVMFWSVFCGLVVLTISTSWAQEEESQGQGCQATFSSDDPSGISTVMMTNEGTEGLETHSDCKTTFLKLLESDQESEEDRASSEAKARAFHLRYQGEASEVNALAEEILNKKNLQSFNIEMNIEGNDEGSVLDVKAIK